MHISRIRTVAAVARAALTAAVLWTAGCGSNHPPARPVAAARPAAAISQAPQPTPAATWPAAPSHGEDAASSGSAAFGFPRRDLRVVAFNVHWDLEGAERVAAAVQPLQPDVLFMEEVMQKDLQDIGSRLGMTSGGKVQVFYSPRPPEGTSGTAIFARFPLSGGRYILPAPDPAEPPGHEDWGHGAWAEATVDGRRIALACVHLTPTQGISPSHLREREQARGKEIAALLDLWRERGSPPAVFGGDFNQLPHGGNYQALSAHLTDALATLGKTDWTCAFGPLHTRIDYIWVSPGWQSWTESWWTATPLTTARCGRWSEARGSGENVDSVWRGLPASIFLGATGKRSACPCGRRKALLSQVPRPRRTGK